MLPRPFGYRPGVAGVVLVAGLALGASGTAQAQQGQLFVYVMNQVGQPVTDLTAEEFAIEEDGLATKIVSAQLGTQPMKVALLVDNGDAVGTDTNSLRDGLEAFLDTLPPKHEVGLFTIARQVRMRVDFTTDRAELKDQADGIFVDTGAGAVMMDGLFETWERRFDDGDFWPVFVLVVTDGAEISGNVSETEYDRFVRELVDRAATVHVVLVSTRGGGIQTNYAINLTQHTGGLYASLAAVTGLPRTLTEYATKMGDHFDQMADRYRVVFERQTDNPNARLGVGVNRPAVAVRLFPGRRLEP